MALLKFSAVIKIIGINPYVTVSRSQAERLKVGWRKPMPVLVKVNGWPKEPWHINMMPAGNGEFYLYLHGDVRKASSTQVGDEVIIELDFDESYKNGPQHPMPEPFAAALERVPIAQTNWDKLPPSRQKEVLRYFSGLKSAEARERNMKKALAVLAGKTERFMGRTWHNGS